MKAFRLNKCENYGVKNCMSSTVRVYVAIDES